MESVGIIWNIPNIKWTFSHLVNCCLAWVSSHFVFFILLSNQLISCSLKEVEKNKKLVHLPRFEYSNC